MAAFSHFFPATILPPRKPSRLVRQTDVHSRGLKNRRKAHTLVFEVKDEKCSTFLAHRAVSGDYSLGEKVMIFPIISCISPRAPARTRPMRGYSRAEVSFLGASALGLGAGAA